MIGFLFKHKNLQNYLLLVMEIVVLLTIVLVLVLEIGVTVRPPLETSVVRKLMLTLFYTDSILIFIFPVFNHELLSVPKARVLNIAWTLVAATDIVILTASFVKSGGVPPSGWVKAVHFAVMQAVFVYSLVLVAVRIKDYEDTEFRTLSKVYISGMAILSALLFVNYFPAWIYTLLGDMSPEMKVILTDYFGKSVFFITANVFLVIVIGRHTVIRPFFLVQIDDNLMNKLSLTVREREIIMLLIEGYTKKEVGEKLFISELTVKTHIQNIYSKLGVSNRVELTNFIKEQTRKAS